MIQGSRFKVQGSRFKGQGSRVKGQGSRVKGQGSRVKGQGSRFKVQGSRFKVQGSRFKVLGSSFLRAYKVSSCYGFTLLHFTFGCERQHNNVLWFTPLYVVRRQLGCTLFKGAHCTPVFPSQLQANSNHESRGYLRCLQW